MRPAHTVRRALPQVPSYGFRQVPSWRQGQQGLSLVTVLMTLGIMMVLGISGGVLVTTQHKAARASQDRVLALQAAQSALYDAESDLNCQRFTSSSKDFCAAGSNNCRDVCVPGSTLAERKLTGFTPYSSGNCTDGWCTTFNLDLGTESAALNAGVIYGTRTNASSLKTEMGLYDNPRYVIEGFVDPGGYPGYRITAKAWGRFAETVVVLQEVYRPW